MFTAVKPKTNPNQIPNDLFGAINELKKKLNAVVLAHYYQEADIQDIADYLGDFSRFIAAGSQYRCRRYCFCWSAFHGGDGKNP